VRAELRPTRAVTVAVVVLFLCALIGLACWSERQSMLSNAGNSAYLETLRQQNSQQTWAAAMQVVIRIAVWTGDLLVPVLPVLYRCRLSVTEKPGISSVQPVSEPAEILIGKLLGEPVLAYFGMLCVLPVTLIAGLLGGLSIWSLVAAYASIIAGALFLGLGGTLGFNSGRDAKPRGGNDRSLGFCMASRWAPTALPHRGFPGWRRSVR